MSGGTMGPTSEMCEDSKQKLQTPSVMLLVGAELLYCAAYGVSAMIMAVSRRMRCCLDWLDYRNVRRSKRLTVYLLNDDDEAETGCCPIVINGAAFFFLV